MARCAGIIALAGLALLGGLSTGTALANPSFQNEFIVDAMAYPWSALGRVNTGGKGHCTGTLISRSHVLTEARCMYNAIEGRWWSPLELHFVAGYQRDTYQIHSGVRQVHVAPGYKAGKWVLTNMMHNWAVLVLDDPIGLKAGWMAVQWRDRNAQTRLERGHAYLIEVGYRAARSHVITLAPDCRTGSSEKNHDGCWLGEAGLAKLIFIDREFRVLAPLGMPRKVADFNLEAISPRARFPEPGGPARRETRANIRDLMQRIQRIGARATASKTQSFIADGG